MINDRQKLTLDCAIKITKFVTYCVNREVIQSSDYRSPVTESHSMNRL